MHVESMPLVWCSFCAQCMFLLMMMCVMLSPVFLMIPWFLWRGVGVDGRAVGCACVQTIDDVVSFHLQGGRPKTKHVVKQEKQCRQANQMLTHHC